MISQYFVPIAEKIGITSSYDQVRYNVGKESWGFLVSLIMASVTPRFPRRRMYLLCASCLLAVYTAWTIAQARNRITGSKESGYAVLVFIFLYSPGKSWAAILSITGWKIDCLQHTALAITHLPTSTWSRFFPTTFAQRA